MPSKSRFDFHRAIARVKKPDPDDEWGISTQGADLSVKRGDWSFYTPPPSDNQYFEIKISGVVGATVLTVLRYYNLKLKKATMGLMSYQCEAEEYTAYQTQPNIEVFPGLTKTTLDLKRNHVDKLNQGDRVLLSPSPAGHSLMVKSPQAAYDQTKEYGTRYKVNPEGLDRVLAIIKKIK
jgi:hypothetical protein